MRSKSGRNAKWCTRTCQKGTCRHCRCPRHPPSCLTVRRSAFSTKYSTHVAYARILMPRLPSLRAPHGNPRAPTSAFLSPLLPQPPSPRSCVWHPWPAVRASLFLPATYPTNLPAHHTSDTTCPPSACMDLRACVRVRVRVRARIALQVLFFELGYSEDMLERFIDYFRSASVSLDICVFSLTHNAIAHAILVAHKRGVKVRLISDDDQVNPFVSCVAFARLQGCNVYTPARQSARLQCLHTSTSICSSI